MSSLDGVWEVRRRGGLLPPMIGVRKRISGDRGETKLGPLPGVPFRVDGLSLRYTGPLRGLVDELEPEGGGFRGRSLLFGRELGRFELRPIFEKIAPMTREERRARNEALFRSLNERLKEIDDRLDTAAVGAPVGDREEFFCECGQLDCMGRLAMTREQYETVRSHPERFIVLAEHADGRIEFVVERNGGYVVVEKRPPFDEAARESDPRSE